MIQMRVINHPDFPLTFLRVTLSMPQSSEKQQAVPVGRIWALFLGSFSLILLSMILGLFDTTTELVPTHDKVDQACLAVAGLCGLLACGAAIYLTRGLTIIQRVMLPLVFLLVTAIGIFLVASRLSSITEGWVDFPAGKSHTSQALLPISRAYQTRGKGSSQYIQTMPIRSNLEITREDFTFMRNHRRPDDNVKNYDEVSSRGYFCAKVSIEQSDKALRILHSGSQKLPQGTVILCPVPTRLP
jgi:hypothetical protein